MSKSNMLCFLRSFARDNGLTFKQVDTVYNGNQGYALFKRGTSEQVSADNVLDWWNDHHWVISDYKVIDYALCRLCRPCSDLFVSSELKDLKCAKFKYLVNSFGFLVVRGGDLTLVEFFDLCLAYCSNARVKLTISSIVKELNIDYNNEALS